MNEEYKKAFIDAGISPRFVSGSLEALGKRTELLRGYVKSVDFQTNLRDGKGLWLHGDDALCEEAMYHLAKSAMVRQFDIAICTPFALQEVLTSPGIDSDLKDRVWDAQAIFLPCFDDSSYQQNPLPAATRLNVEDFLLSRLRKGIAVSVHTVDSSTAWWSPRLTRWLANNTEGFNL